jgi:hypothetical protein
MDKMEAQRKEIRFEKPAGSKKVISDPTFVSQAF